MCKQEPEVSGGIQFRILLLRKQALAIFSGDVVRITYLRPLC